MLARTVAGNGIPNTLFRVCAGCGKVDTETNRNAGTSTGPGAATGDGHGGHPVGRAQPHAATQGLALTLPMSVTMGDTFAVPSLAAALLLGLRERIGGDPDHISVVTVPAPVGRRCSR